MKPLSAAIRGQATFPCSSSCGIAWCRRYIRGSSTDHNYGSGNDTIADKHLTFARIHVSCRKFCCTCACNCGPCAALLWRICLRHQQPLKAPRFRVPAGPLLPDHSRVLYLRPLHLSRGESVTSTCGCRDCGLTTLQERYQPVDLATTWLQAARDER